VFNTLNRHEKQQVMRLLTEEIDTAPTDPKVLKAFLLSSEYMINNHSPLAATVRQNRIKAYHALERQNDTAVRPTETPATRPTIIPSKVLEASYNGKDRYQLEYSPIYFSEYQHFDKLNIIDVKALSLGVATGPEAPTKYTLDLIELTNIKEYNVVLNSFSWTFKSSIAYQDEFLFNHEFMVGRAWNLFNKTLIYGLVGGTYANYDDMSDLHLSDSQVLETLEVGTLNQLSTTLKLNLKYSYKYRNDFIITELLYKPQKIIYGLSLTSKKDETLLGVSFRVLF